MYKQQFLHALGKKSALISSFLFFLSSALALLFTYRLGSMRIDKGQTPGLRDIGTYFSGGLTILQGDNPYENPFFRIGPTGGFLLGILAKLAPDFLAATMIMALSIFGFVYFVCTFAGYESIRSFPWLFMGVLIFISSQRENLVNIQITGVLALFTALGFRLIECTSPVKIWVGVVLIAIAMETKPHLLALFVVVLLIYRDKQKLLIRIAIMIILSHLLISLYVGQLITLKWLRLLADLGSSAKEGTLPERIAFETPFNFFGISPNVSSMIMLTIFLTFSFVLIKLAHRVNTNFLALLIPSFGVFFHFYDLALAFGLMLSFLYKNQRFKTLFLIFGAYLVPQKFDTPTNWTLVLALMLILAISIHWRKPIKVVLHFGLGAGGWLTYIFLVNALLPFIDIHELSMTLSVVIALFASINISLKSRQKTIHSTNER
jgi:hypothetical protein